jgi:hypothetical protein
MKISQLLRASSTFHVRTKLNRSHKIDCDCFPRSLDLRQHPIAQQTTLPQFVREVMPTVRQLNGEFLLFPKFDNTAIQKPPNVSFAGPDASINFDDVAQRLKNPMDEVSASLKECQQRLSQAEVLVHRRLKEVKE